MMRWPFLLALASLAAPAQEPAVRFTTTTRLVIVNVEVRDRSGRPLESLTKDDFEVFEDGVPQKISVFEFQRLDSRPQPAPLARADRKPTSAASATDITPSQPGEIRYKDRRLIVLLFDQSSMPPEDQIRAIDSARAFIREKMTPADLVAVMSFSNELRVLQDFTMDRDRLAEVVGGLRIGETAELAAEAAAGEEEEAGEDTGAAFTADETEFNIFNTDRKLSALETAAKMLASLPEKKAVVYFSSGVGRTGVENQSQLRATVNAAVRGNVSFYPVDARGLVAEAPGGDVRVGSTRGSSMYSGAAQRQRRDRFFNQQETLFSLAADTGGRALLDNNDLSLGIVQAQQDISSYYILGYYTTNPAEDGKFRRIQVRVLSQPGARLEYRSGYYAPKEFKDFNASDRERQLEEALLLDDPITDLPLALEVHYFRRAPGRYVVPVAVKIPGSEIPLTAKKGRRQTRLDFIGQVREANGRLAGTVRDHIVVKLAGENQGELVRRQLQYDTAFSLPPGNYSLKFLVRENETGKMGTFETRFSVPDLDQENSYLRLSSVVWANQREPLKAAVGAASRNKKAFAGHPLVQQGHKLIPSITKVFRKDQELYVYFEVYDAGLPKQHKPPSIAAGLSLFRGHLKAFESEPYRLTQARLSKAGAVSVEMRLPLSDLEPGRYTCQLNVIDETGRKFAFRRTPLVLLPPA